MELADAAVVQAFVQHLARTELPGLRIDRRPDLENRSGQDIDAIAGPLAIEHTSIDSAANQRGLDAQFMDEAGMLEYELAGQIPSSIRLQLPYTEPRSRAGRRNILAALRRWISEEAERLPDGSHEIRDVPGVPFAFGVDKAPASDNRPAGPGFVRFAPNTDDLSVRLRRLCDRKAEKLIPYRDQGLRTVLLVESTDVALMNRGIFLGALRDAYNHRLPAGVDELWYAETGIPEELLFTNLTEDVQHPDKPRRP